MCQRILINVYVHARCVCVLFVFFIEMAHKMIAYVYNEKRGVRGNGGKLYIYYNHGRGIKLSPFYNFEHDRTCTRTHTRACAHARARVLIHFTELRKCHLYSSQRAMVAGG